jgi:hypothetical protein
MHTFAAHLACASAGFNVEKVQYKNVVFTVWDVGGQEKLRPLWKHYFNNTDALIFVVDSADRERLRAAADEFKVFLLNSVIMMEMLMSKHLAAPRIYSSTSAHACSVYLKIP